jgi:hypothetical protein
MAWEAWVVAMGASMDKVACRVWIWGLMLLLTGLEMDVDLHLSLAMHVMGLRGDYGVEVFFVLQVCMQLSAGTFGPQRSFEIEDWNSDEDIYDDMMNCVK